LVSAAQDFQSDELRRLKAELKRIKEERDILKKAAAYFADIPVEACVHPGAPRDVAGTAYGQSLASAPQRLLCMEARAHLCARKG